MRRRKYPDYLARKEKAESSLRYPNGKRAPIPMLRRSLLKADSDASGRNARIVLVGTRNRVTRPAIQTELHRNLTGHMEIAAMKIALVCDSMSAYGGAERVIEQILKIYPLAALFALLDIVPSGQRAFLNGRPVKSSFLQKLPLVPKYYRSLLHLWPLAVEQLDVTDYDLVISSHHSVAYGVLTRPDQVHVCYVHSPMRYAWDLQHEYLREARLDRGFLSFLARRTLHKARIWDYTAAQRPDAFATNSHFVAQRLWKAHRRDAKVIYPPVDTDGDYAPKYDGGYYLSVGRLVPYKRVDLLVRAFAMM